MLKDILKIIEETTGLGIETQGKIFASLFIIVLFWILKFAINKFLARRIEDAKVIYRLRKTISYVFFVLGFLLVFRMWFTGIQSIATFAGLLSAGIAIALQSPIINLAGWAFILWRKPFEIGDRVEVGSHRGDVIDQRLFVFTLMELGNWVDADQSTGRIIHIPNGKVFTDTVANYNKGFKLIWNEIPVLLTFESDWKKALDILNKISEKHTTHLSQNAEQQLRKAAQKMMIHYNKLTPKVYLNVKDSGVLLTIRVLCNPRNRRDMDEKIWMDILEEFAKHKDIDFAYPTQRFYLNKTEGKKSQNPDEVNTEED